ncbi:MAG TPA: hypothetical protein VGD54_15190, partial [Steroidobacteraceae bacterium]
MGKVYIFSNRFSGALLGGLLCATAGPQVLAADGVDSQPLQQIVVVGTTPVPGMTMDVDKVAGNVQTLFSADLRQD